MVFDNIVFAPIAELVLSALLIVGLHLSRPKFSYYWLVATFGAMIALSTLLLSRWVIPISIDFPVWGPESIYKVSPSFLVDEVSWIFGVVICTLILSSLLTEVARPQELGWLVWVGKLLLGSVGLISIFSGNPLTLVLTWGAIDLAELFIMLLLVNGSHARERVVISFSARTAGSMMLVVVLILAEISGASDLLLFPQFGESGSFIPAQVAVVMFIAAGLRLGVIPLHLPVIAEESLRSGFGTVIRAIAAATGLILLVRVANFGLEAQVRPIFHAFAALASISAGVSWIGSKSGIEGRSFWILGMASISMAAAVRTEPNASLAWAIAALLPGSLLFFNTTEQLFSKILLAIGWIGLTVLPFTPTWAGVALFIAPFRALMLVFLFSHSLLLIGFLKHAIRERQPITQHERWISVIYVLGLSLIPFIYWAVGLLQISQVYNEMVFLSISFIWPGMTIIFVLGLIIFLYLKRYQPSSVPRLASGWMELFRSILSLDWFYRILWRLYRSLSRSVSFFSAILEGNGGVLWTLLLMVLLFTFLAQNAVSGN